MFQLAVAGAMALVALYVTLRFVFPLPLPLALKILLALALFVAAERLFVVRMVMGAAGTWNMSREMLISTGFAQFFVMVLFLLTIGRDLLLLAGRLLRRLGWFAWPDGAVIASTPTLAAGLFCGAILLTTWGMWQALKIPEVREARLAVPHLSPSLEGLRVVQLSDLHVSNTFNRNWIQELVDRTNALKPDLVVITGDLTDGAPGHLARAVAPLKGLKATYGIFIVPGNHDYFASFHPWMRLFQKMGLNVLLNEHQVIAINGAQMVIAGVTDPMARRVGQEPPDIKKALQHAPQGAFRLLLAHQPVDAKKHSAAGVDLQLSGHTHGGQILPLQFLASRFNGGYVAGLYNVNGMPLYVHPGSALWAGSTLRLGVPSEIALLILEQPSDKKRKDENDS